MAILRFAILLCAAASCTANLSSKRDLNQHYGGQQHLFPRVCNSKMILPRSYGRFKVENALLPKKASKQRFSPALSESLNLRGGVEISDDNQERPKDKEASKRRVRETDDSDHIDTSNMDAEKLRKRFKKLQETIRCKYHEIWNMREELRKKDEKIEHLNGHYYVNASILTASTRVVDLHALLREPQHPRPNWVDSLMPPPTGISLPSITRYQPSKQLRNSYSCDIFGNPVHYEAETQLAHLIGDAQVCRNYSKPVIKYLAGLHGGKVLTEEEIQFLTNGWSRNQQRQPHVGMMNQCCNLIRLKNQYSLFDCSPDVMLLPMCRFNESCSWEGAAYNCLVIARNSRTFVDIGANTEHVKEIRIDNEVNRQQVNECLEEFAKAFVEIVSYVCHFEAPDEATLRTTTNGENKICKELRDYLKRVGTCPVPILENIANNSKFCFVSFTDAILYDHVRNGTFVVQNGSHPAACPFFLYVRASSSWLDFLWHEDKLPGFSECPKRGQMHCVLIPQCLDLDRTGGDCRLCRHWAPFYDPDIGPVPFEDQFEAIWGESDFCVSGNDKASATASKSLDYSSGKCSQHRADVQKPALRMRDVAIGTVIGQPMLCQQSSNISDSISALDRLNLCLLEEPIGSYDAQEEAVGWSGVNSVFHMYTLE